MEVAERIAAVRTTDREILCFIETDILVLQNARIVDIDRLTIPEKHNDDTESYRGFSGRDRHHHKYKQLPGHICVVARERHERQVYGIEHQLDAHEHPECVALEYHADRSDRK